MRGGSPPKLRPPRFTRPDWLRAPRLERPAWLTKIGGPGGRAPGGGAGARPPLWKDPGLLASAAAALILVAIAAALIVSGGAPDVRAVVPAETSPSPTVVAGPATASPVTSVSPAPIVAGNEAVGTAMPVETSAAVPPAPAPATPTPTPDPNVWRFQGRVVTEAGEPIADACVVIGPHGCRPFGPHTDDQGSYYIDMPQNPTIVYELRFEKEGYTTVYYRVQPTAPTEFNVVLRPS